MKSQKGGLALTLQEAGGHGNFFNGNERFRKGRPDLLLLRGMKGNPGIVVSLKRGMCKW